MQEDNFPDTDEAALRSFSNALCNKLTPTLGRIVHFVLLENSAFPLEHRAAIVTSDFDCLTVNLAVFLDQAGDVSPSIFIPILIQFSVIYDETGLKPGTWHWPERAGATRSFNALAIPTFIKENGVTEKVDCTEASPPCSGPCSQTRRENEH